MNPDIIPPAKWRELLALAVIRDDFDVEDGAVDVGLTEEQTAALRAWRDDVLEAEDVRQRQGEMSPSTRRFLEELSAEAERGEPSDALMHALDNPPLPGPKLKALMRRKVAREK